MKKLFFIVLFTIICVTGFSQIGVKHRPFYVLNDLALDTITGGFLFSDTTIILEMPLNAAGFNVIGTSASIEDSLYVRFKVADDADSTNSYVAYGDTLLFEGSTSLTMEKEFFTYPFLIIEVESVSADTNSGYFDLMFRLTRKYKE
jgi:hypothetical protein